VKLKLGCIADDFTGATDLANTLSKAGMQVVQTTGIPKEAYVADAIVIALKSRTIAAAEAISESLAALQWLQDAGAEQFFFKYCSTFDSTPEGNIGPVADALLDALGESFTIACPAFPDNGRSIYKGYLYVGDVLLSESSMKNHPLTPMHDANLQRVLAEQTSHSVALVELETVKSGADAIQDRFEVLKQSKHRFAIVDATSNQDLMNIGSAVKGLKLITGGSGAALGLPENFGFSRKQESVVPNIFGRAVVLAGSCSQATRAQIARAQQVYPHYQLQFDDLADREKTINKISRWAIEQDVATPVMVYSCAKPEDQALLQEHYGRLEAGEIVEAILSGVAKELVKHDFRRIVVAGGETSGAITQVLNIQALEIGAEIDPGVPWTTTLTDTPLALTLKSGNFGSEDFFIKALDMLPTRKLENKQ